jgi:hypothetical protein
MDYYNSYGIEMFDLNCHYLNECKFYCQHIHSFKFRHRYHLNPHALMLLNYHHYQKSDY